MAQRAKIIKADYLLQDKIGYGAVDDRIIQNCQTLLDNNPFDFQPVAQEILDTLQDTIQKYKTEQICLIVAKNDLTDNIMQLKSNAPLFQYDLVGNLAAIMLNFLERIEHMNDHVIDIVSAHHKTQTIIITKKIKGNGGDVGKQFEKELHSVCDRYFKVIKNTLI